MSIAGSGFAEDFRHMVKKTYSDELQRLMRAEDWDDFNRRRGRLQHMIEVLGEFNALVAQHIVEEDDDE